MFVYHNLLSEYADDIIKTYHETEDHKTESTVSSKASSLYLPNPYDFNDAESELFDKWVDLSIKIQSTVSDTVLNDYISKYGPYSRDYMFLSCYIIHYPPGTKANLHTDTELLAKDIDNHLGYAAPLSVVAYLNDDYDGGEIVFPHQNVKWKPKKGSVLVCPSGFAYPHYTEVADKDRYALICLFIKRGEASAPKGY